MFSFLQTIFHKLTTVIAAAAIAIGFISAPDLPKQPVLDNQNPIVAEQQSVMPESQAQNKQSEVNISVETEKLKKEIEILKKGIGQQNQSPVVVTQPTQQTQPQPQSQKPVPPRPENSDEWTFNWNTWAWEKHPTIPPIAQTITIPQSNQQTVPNIQNQTSQQSTSVQPSTTNQSSITAPQDIIPPTITDLRANIIKSTSVSITWNTNEPSKSVLYYSTNTNFLSGITLSENFTNSHQYTISGLNENTKYYYKIVFIDAAGNSNSSDVSSFVTPKIGTLSIALTQDNPLSQSVNRTNYGSNSESEIEFLKITLSASQDEGIMVRSISTTLTKDFEKGHCALYINDIKYSQGPFYCGDFEFPYSIPEVTISAGSQKVLSFRITPLQDEESITTSLNFITSKMNTVGIKSHESVRLSSMNTMYGNNITLIGMPTFNYNPSSQLRNITPGRGRVLEIAIDDATSAGMNLYKTTFKIDSTDVAYSNWNTCGAGKIETSDFKLFDNINIQNTTDGFSGGWELLNTNGAPCSNGQKVGYMRFTFSNPKTVLKNSYNILIFNADTSGATVGDQVRFYLMNDDSYEIKNLEWARLDDGIHRSGYRIRNLPIQGINIRYSSL